MASGRIKQFAAECLRLLWMVFFRRTSFEREIKEMGRRERWRLILRAIVITIVMPFLITTIAGLALKIFGIPFDFLTAYRETAKIVVGSVAGGFALGVALAVLGGVAEGVALGVAVSVAVGVTVGVAVSFAVGVAAGVTVFVAVAVTGSVALGVALGVTLGVPIAIAIVVAVAVTVVVAGGVAIAVALGIARGAAFGLSEGVVGGIAVCICVILSYLRAPFFLTELPTTLWGLWRIRLQPQHAARFLRHSLAYWDELFLLPQPLLARLVVAAGEQDAEAGREAIEHLLTNTFQQKVAEDAMIELESRALLRCDSVETIAARGAGNGWLATAPNDKRLSRAVAVFAQCEKAASEIGAAVAATSNYQKLAAFHRARRLLDGMAKATLGMRGKQRQNFARIARHWSALVNAEIDRLAHEEQTAEHIPNPFIANTALAPGSETFLGRAAAYRFVEEHFLRAGQTATLVLYGQPRIGKSSFLRNLKQRLTTDLIPVYVDMQAAAQVESAGGLLFNLSQAITRELASRGVTIKAPSLNDYATEPFIVFNQFLDQTESAIGAPESRLILALDEFEEIEKKLTEGRISADLMPFLRSVMQQRQGVSLLFAGTHRLDEMIGELWTPYFRSAVPCRVSYLDEASARKLITQPIEDFSLSYEAEAVDLLIRETHCHPCLIQLACLSLVDLKNEQRSRLATIEDVQKSLALALENGDYAFQGVWEWIPAKERPLLALLASNEPALVEEMAQRLAKSEAEVRGMAERLTEAEVLGREGDETRYRFQVPLLRQWVARYAVLKGMDFGKRQAAD